MVDNNNNGNKYLKFVFFLAFIPMKLKKSHKFYEKSLFSY